MLNMLNLLICMTTLYRKYRPQHFSDVADQAHIINTLLNEVALGTVAHAYLFCGPRGVGKTTTARLLAKAINCEKRAASDGEPCNECSSCGEITAGRSIDVIEIDAASQTGVDNVRENIIENAQFKPTKSKFKVFIIDEVHMLSTSAFNALLKTLEEPPAHIIFILATTELQKLPATVISRCQRFTFKKISRELMLERLSKICTEEKVKVDADVLERIVRKSEGGLRDAESILGQIMALGLKKVTAADIQALLPTTNIESVVDFIEHLAQSKPADAITLLGDTYNQGTNMDQFAYDTLETLRVMLVSTVTKNTILFKADYSAQSLTQIAHIGNTLGAQTTAFLIDRLLKRRLEIKTTPFPQLPLELFVVDATMPRDVPPTSPTPLMLRPPQSPAPTPSTPSQQSPRAPQAPVATAPIAAVQTSEVSTTPAQPASSQNSSSSLPSYSIKTTIEAVKAKWDAFIQKVSATNHSLTFILKMCGLKHVDEHGLTLTVPYSFHKEKLEEIKSKKVLEEYLSELCGERIPIVCEIEALATPEPDTELTALATSFGGEVLE